MSVKAYRRFELAENQLQTAILLFISGGERFSVISLAGAADVILSRLIMNRGEENFTDRMMQKDLEKGEQVGTKGTYGNGINNMLFINQLKHMDDDDDGMIELDPEECALASVMKALANYVDLPEHDKEFVDGFKAWLRTNLDPKKYNVNGDSEEGQAGNDA